MSSNDTGTGSERERAARTLRFWLVWIAVYNVAFLVAMAAFHGAGRDFLWFLPTTTWVYLGLLVVIAIPNWILGWAVMSRETTTTRHGEQ